MTLRDVIKIKDQLTDAWENLNASLKEIKALKEDFGHERFLELDSAVRSALGSALRAKTLYNTTLSTMGAYEIVNTSNIPEALK